MRLIPARRRPDRSPSAPRARSPRRWSPGCEALENRQLLATVIDNGGPGYSEVGAWIDGSGGIGGGHRRAAVNSGVTATYTATNLATGWYLVQATWDPTPGYSLQTPFRISDGTQVLRTIRANQEVAPNGSEIDGTSNYSDLATVYVDGGVLAVEIAADHAYGGLGAAADAVRISPAAAPAWKVIDDGGDGFTTTGDWGVTHYGYENTRHVATSTAGDGSATANWQFDGLPDGEYIVQATSIWGHTYVPYQIYNGSQLLRTAWQSQGAEARYGTEEGGVHFRTLGIVAIDSGSLKVSLSNTVPGQLLADAVRILPASHLNSRLVDDADPRFYLDGRWFPINGGYAGGSHFSGWEPDPAPQSATWQLSNLAPGDYVVRASWLEGWSRSTNTPYKIYDGDNLIKTVRVDQHWAAEGIMVRGEPFEALTTMHIASGRLRVIVTDEGTTNWVMVDAILVEDAPTTPLPVIVENGRAGYSEVGAWETYTIGYHGNVRVVMEPGAVAAWQPDPMKPGDYSVQVTWGVNAWWANVVTYKVFDGSTLLDEVAVDQNLEPTGDAVAGGRNFQTLGTYHFAAGAPRVELSTGSRNAAIADAVRFAAVVATVPLVIDNGSAGYAEVGTWTTVNDGYNGDHRYSTGDMNVATWTSPTLPAGVYTIQAAWDAAANHTIATYRISVDGVEVRQVSVDQRVAPQTDAVTGGKPFQNLATIASAGGKIRVVLLGGTNGVVAADAIRIAATTADVEGDTLAAALDAPLTAGTWYEHRAVIGDGLYPDRDVDLYSVTLAAGQRINVDIDARSPGLGAIASPLDGELRIFDASGAELASNDDGIDLNTGILTPGDPALTYTATAAGTYYVGVSSHSGRNYDPTVAGSGSAGTPGDAARFGAYRLRVSPGSAPLAAPAGFSAATFGSTQIGLSWAAVAGATGYTIERSPDGASGWTEIATLDGWATAYPDSGLSAGTVYRYRIRAFNGQGTSPYSSPAVATTLPASSGGQAATAVSIEAIDASASEAGQDPATFRISRTGSLAFPLVVRYIVGGAASRSYDYTGISTTFDNYNTFDKTIPAGVAFIDITLTPVVDTFAEAPESIAFGLLGDPAYTLADRSVATATIADDPSRHNLVSIVATTAIAAEAGASPAVFRVSRTGSTAAPLVVYYSVGGSALKDIDYTGLPTAGFGFSHEVTIPAGAADFDFAITAMADTEAEPNETIVLRLVAGSDYSLADRSVATATIAENAANNNVVTILAIDSAASESGPDSATFRVYRTGSIAASLFVDFMAGGSASVDYDYSFSSQVSRPLAFRVTIPAGMASIDFSVTPYDDANAEQDETVVLSLSNGNAYMVGDRSVATATIAASDGGAGAGSGPNVSIAAVDAAATELGQDPAIFRASRTGSTVGNLDVSFGATGSATWGLDYTTDGLYSNPFTGRTTIRIPDGAAYVDFGLIPSIDILEEGAETASISLVAGSGYSVADMATATVTIADDSSKVNYISIAAVDPAGSESGQDPVTFRVTRSGGVAAELIVYYTTSGSADGHSAVFADYTGLPRGGLYDLFFQITIPAGMISKDFVLIPKVDTLVEGSESVTISISPTATYPNNAATPLYRLADMATATAMIADDTSMHNLVSIAAVDPDASEVGSNTATFRISRTGSVAAPLVVAYRHDGTAVPSTDYSGLPMNSGVGPAYQVTIPANSSYYDFSITPAADSLAEGPETVALSLVFGPPTSYSPGYIVGNFATATAVIADASPSTPAGLIATLVSTSRVDLTWEDAAGESGYRIERSPDGSSGWALIGTVPADTVRYSNEGLFDGRRYYFRVIATADGGYSSNYSNIASVMVPLIAPANLTATLISGNRIELSWSDRSAGESGYSIERSPDGTTGWQQAGSVGANATSFSAPGPFASSTFYYFRARAYSGTAESSAYSTTALVTTPAFPNPPAGLTAVGASESTIVVAWTVVAGVNGYRVERSIDGNMWTQDGTVGAGVTSYVSSGLQESKHYYHRVLGFDAVGESAFSVSVNAVTFPAAPTSVTATVVSGERIDIDWADSSGGELGYKVDQANQAGGPWVPLGVVAANATNFAAPGPFNGSTVYYFRVRAYNTSGASAPSGTSVTTPAFPNPPTGLKVTSLSPSAVGLGWEASADATSYLITRRIGTGAWVQVGTAAAGVTSFTDATVVAGTIYTYGVATVAGAVASGRALIGPVLARDGAADQDNDGLTNIQEANLGTNPTYFDTDGDLLPDGWEAKYTGFDPKIADPAQGDADGDGLANLGEYTHDTDPTLGDTDGDDASDFDEVESGANPNDASDGGVAPADDMKGRFRLTVGDPSSSQSERWRLEVGDVRYVSPGFGIVGYNDFTFQAGKSYDVRLKHVGSTLSPPDYDWTASILPTPNKPTVPFFITDGAPILGEHGDDSTFGSKVAHFHIPLLDVDVDSDNNDEFNAPGRTKEEDRLEQTTGGAKILTADTGDVDEDGVPDYADFDGIDGRKFVPLILNLSDNVRFADPSKIEFSFSYDASDATANLRTGNGTADDPYVYKRAPGSLRIWRKDASATRDKDGDYIHTGEKITAEELGLQPGGTVTLYVEAVAGSTSYLAVDVSAAVTGGKWSGTLSDKVYFASTETRYVEVGVDGDLTVVENLPTSSPSPQIANVTIAIVPGSLRSSADRTRILADLTVEGNLDDAASDLIEGLAGTIQSVGLFLNGSDSPLTLIATNVSKSPGGQSLLKPFDFSASFSTILAGVELAAGWNHLHLSASNYFGFSGHADGSIRVDLVAPTFEYQGPTGLGVEVRLAFARESYLDDAADVSLSYRLNGGGWTQPVSLARDPAGAPDEARFSNGLNSVAFTASNAFDPQSPDQPTVVVTVPDAALDGVEFPFLETGDDTKIFDGTLVIPLSDLPILTGYQLVVGETTGIDASGPGEFRPILIEVVGPHPLLEAITGAKLSDESDTNPRNPKDYQIKAVQDRMFLGNAGAIAPRPLLAMATPKAMPQPAQPAQPAERRDGEWNYAKGIGAGLLDTGWDLWDGVATVAGGAWHAVKNYNPFTVTYRYLIGESIVTVKDQHAVYTAWDTAEAIAGFVQKIMEDQRGFVEATLVGDNDELNRLGSKYATAFEYSVEILQELSTELVLLDDFTIGRIAGRIIGEVALAIATDGATVALKGATIAKVAPKLKNIPYIAEHAAIVNKLTKLADVAVEFVNNKICFVAGTPIQTPDGPRSIETIVPGDWVLSRDGQTEEQAYKQVLDTFVTHPDRLRHVRFRIPSGVEAEIVGTAEHPFFVVGRNAFVPAGELRPEDELVMADGGPAVVVEVFDETSPDGRPFTTYNFEVAEFHTYFAGAGGVWVHNSGNEICDRVFSLFRKYMDRDTPGNPMAAYNYTRKRMTKMSDETNREFVDRVLDEIKKQSDSGTLNPKWQEFGMGDPSSPNVMKPREVFAAYRYEAKTGLSVRRPAIVRDAQGKLIDKGDFIDTNGDFWDIKGPVVKDGVDTVQKFDTYLNSLVKHINLHPNGDQKLLVDVAGFDQHQIQRVKNLLAFYNNNYYMLMTH